MKLLDRITEHSIPEISAGGVMIFAVVLFAIHIYWACRLGNLVVTR